MTRTYTVARYAVGDLIHIREFSYVTQQKQRLGHVGSVVGVVTDAYVHAHYTNYIDVMTQYGEFTVSTLYVDTL